MNVQGDPWRRKNPALRKRRTRQHVIAAQSIHHVEGFIIDEGHSAERPGSDYGYDLVVFTFDAQGYAEEGAVYVQVKASEELAPSRDDLVMDVDVRDCALWTAEPMPVILILYDATMKRAYWLYVQRYFAEDPSRGPRPGAKTIRVRIPRRQVFNRRAIRRIRTYKQEVLEQLEGAIDHG